MSEPYWVPLGASVAAAAPSIPPRIAAAAGAPPGNDLNLINESGWWVSSSMTNAPNANWYWVFSLYVNDNYQRQELWDMISTAPSYYYRQKSGGTWGAWTAGGGGGRVVIPIRLRVPRSFSLGGNATFNVIQMSWWDMAVWDFADAVEGRIYGHVRLPPSLAATPNANIVIVHMNSGAAGNVYVQTKVMAVVPGGSFHQDFGATYGPGAQAVAGLTLAETTYALGAPTAGSLTLAASRELVFEITRYGAHASDTATGSWYILDAYIEVST